MEPVVVEGKLAVLTDDAYGLYYRIADGKPVKQCDRLSLFGLANS